MIRKLRSQHQGRNYQNNIEGQYWGHRVSIGATRSVAGPQGQYRSHRVSTGAPEVQHRRAGTKQFFPPEWKSGLCCCRSISAKLQLIWNHCCQFKMLGHQAHWIGLSIKTYRIKADERLSNSMVLRPWRRKMIKYAPVTPFCSGNPKVQSMLAVRGSGQRE